MPYDLSLQAHCLPEFYAEAPKEWETRLREVSPILPNLSHLRFRKFEPREDWLFPDRPIWALYRATPRHLVEPSLAAMCNDKHWSEFPTEAERVAQRSVVSSYQHFMWHTAGVFVAPFWLLQGEWGGTPMKYTKRELAYLRGSNAITEPFPIGWFRGAPFNELAVQKILERDRLIQAGNRFDALEKENRPDWKKAEDEAAEQVYRETVLQTLAEMAAPAVEFMQSQRAKAELADAEQAGWLPPAPKGLPNTLATWKEVWMEKGVMPDVAHAPVRKCYAVS